MEKAGIEPRSAALEEHALTTRPTRQWLTDTTYQHQACELRMEKSAEKWGPGGLLKPPVRVQGATPPGGGQGAKSTEPEAEAF